MAEQITEIIPVEIQLEPGGVGELSVYWNEERISIKGDPIEQIIEEIRKRTVL